MAAVPTQPFLPLTRKDVMKLRNVNLPEIVSEDEFRLRFQDWRKEHGKTYSSAEETEQRFQVFKKNYEIIRQHNADPNVPHLLGLNHFADITHREYRAKCLMPGIVLRPEFFSQLGRTTVGAISMEAHIPDSIDGEE